MADIAGVCQELKVTFAKDLGHPAIMGNVPVGITACKQQKSALVIWGQNRSLLEGYGMAHRMD